MTLTDPTPRPTQPDIESEVRALLDALRDQAKGQHWSITISGTADGAESVEVLTTAQTIRDGFTVISGSTRTIVCRKAPDGSPVRMVRPYQHEVSAK